ncbi:MAG: tetraacyldisaccharide 4'-kinase [Desulfuromonadales bacterium]
MTTSCHTYWRELANGTRTGFTDHLLIMLLAPFSLAYSFAQRLRAALYHIGILTTYRLPRPVVSIGNITVGGTGKTPVTAYIAEKLLAQGYRVAVLSRGYGGSLEGQSCVVSNGSTVMMSATECGDEPFLLASTVPGVMVVIGTDRYATGLLAMQQLSPDVFLLDDGFQHMRLHRDLNILLLDHNCPFGNGWTLPTGLLREPRPALLRADWIIHTRCDGIILNIPGLEHIPHIASRHRLSSLTPLIGSAAVPVKDLGNLVAFAGIAEPERFFGDLRKLSNKVVQTLALPDHAPYTPAVISTIAAMMRDSGADYAVTTGKDAVKMKHVPPELAARILVANLELQLDCADSLMNDLFNVCHKSY